MKVIVILLEFVVSDMIVQIMVPVRVAANLQIEHRVVTFPFDDANSRRSMRVGEEMSIGRGTHYVLV